MVNKKILVVDDEKNIVDILRFNLSKEGFNILEAFDGEQGLNIALKESPDLVVLDVMLPKMDGFTVCKRIRQSSAVPVLMLTAKEEEVDKVLGLELGADDYITKPFSTRELIARIKANLRRKENGNGLSSNSIINCGGISINVDKYEVKREKDIVELTIREFELVKYLASRKGQIFTRESLLEKVWGYEYYGDVRTVDVTVRRIREKMEKNPANPQYLMTKRGVGYYFNDNE